MYQEADTRKGFLRRFVSAGRIPLGFAVALSAYALTLGKKAAAQLGMSLPLVVAVYVVTASVIALMIALFGTLATSRSRGAGLGFLTGMTLAVAANFSLLPAVGIGPMTLLQLVVYMLVLGLLGAWAGALYWEPAARD